MEVKFPERIPARRSGCASSRHRRVRAHPCAEDLRSATRQRRSTSRTEVIGRRPFRIEGVQTDNPPSFGSKAHGDLEELDIRHVRIRPRTPRLNGNNERSHRSDNEELYQLLDKHHRSSASSNARECHESPCCVQVCSRTLTRVAVLAQL